MSDALKIAVNGDLGSGKSRLAERLAEAFDARCVSSGELQRALAQELGLSTLQLNLRAEQDPSIDARIDGELQRLGVSPERLVLDSRLAFHFIPQALSIHLLAHPVTAAERITSSRIGEVESYSSAQEAVLQLSRRRKSERDRFLAKYGVRIDELNNYDLVVQTDLVSEADVAEVCLSYVEAAVRRGSGAGETAIFLNPNCVLPTRDIRQTAGDGCAETQADDDLCVSVVHCDGLFFAMDGHTGLAKASKEQARFVQCRLQTPDGEATPAGLSACDHARSTFSPAKAREWEQALGFRYGPHLIAEASATP